MDTTKVGYCVSKAGQARSGEFQPQKLAAFTLLELIVVIAMVCALCALLLPARAYTTDLDKRAACRNNLRQLAVAMTLYAGEHGGKLLPDA
jgi:type II secretory pathway pseudopilin PulG